ncbi:MAG: hypothetical protein FIA99_04790 [Ruminiclostridium sp.]|nr:hypothetical protein [Ruminiclostridium sp.]
MLCQQCNKRPANVHLTKIVNGSKVEMLLCDQCARGKSQLGFGGFGPSLNINDFLSGFIGLSHIDIHAEHVPKEACCEVCGMGFGDFGKTGKMGCGNCYSKFGEMLKPVLKRLHGNYEHTGKAPAGISKVLEVSREVERLKELLGKAVQNEEYEKAAEIRDRIKAVEGGLKE